MTSDRTVGRNTTVLQPVSDFWFNHFGSLYIFSFSCSRVYYACSTCFFWNNSFISDYSLVLFTSWFGSLLLLPPPPPLHYILLYAWAHSGISLAFFGPSWQLLLLVSTFQHKIDHVLRKLMYLCELSIQESLICRPAVILNSPPPKGMSMNDTWASTISSICNLTGRMGTTHSFFMLLGIHDAELINDLICIPSWGYGPFIVRNNVVFSIMRLGVTYICKISLPIISAPIMHAKMVLLLHRAGVRYPLEMWVERPSWTLQTI